MKANEIDWSKLEYNPCTAHCCYCFFDRANAPCSEKEVQEMLDSVERATKQANELLKDANESK